MLRDLTFQADRENIKWEIQFPLDFVSKNSTFLLQRQPRWLQKCYLFTSRTFSNFYIKIGLSIKTNIYVRRKFCIPGTLGDIGVKPGKLFNPFFPNAPFLYPLKTSKPYGFFMFSGGRKKRRTLGTNGLM